MRRTAAAVVAVSFSLVLTSCTLGRPWPERPPALASHHTVLMIGDSLVGQNDSEMRSAFDRAGLDVEVIDAHANGSGLLGPVGDQPSALEWVQAKVAAHPDVTTVVIEWGGACASACDPEEPDFVEYGSPEFLAEWTANAHEIIDWLHEQGKVVAWVISPPFGLDAASDATSQLRVTVAAQLAALDRDDFSVRAGTTRIDWSAALTNVLGQYRTDLFYDGGVHTVRAPDLVHLTISGAERTSAWTVTPLAQLWAANPGMATAGAATGGGPASAGTIEAGDPVSIDVPPGL